MHEWPDEVRIVHGEESAKPELAQFLWGWASSADILLRCLFPSRRLADNT